MLAVRCRDVLWAALLIAGLASCQSEYSVNTEATSDGEAGADLQQVYSQEFIVPKGQYFEALNAVYSFASAQTFARLEIGRCFGSTLQLRVPKLDEPCIAFWASKGSPTKTHLTFTVLENQFFLPDGRDHFRYRVELYVYRTYQPVREIGDAFQAEVEPRLRILSENAVSSNKPLN